MTFRPNDSAKAGALTSFTSSPPAELEETFQDRACDRGGIDLVHFAAVVNIEVSDAFRRDLGEKETELLAKTQMRSNDREGLGVEVRHIDGVADGAFEEGGLNGLGDFDADTFLRFGGGSAQMRSEDQGSATFRKEESGGNGSVSKTSSAAPATWPLPND